MDPPVDAQTDDRRPAIERATKSRTFALAPSIRNLITASLLVFVAAFLAMTRGAGVYVTSPSLLMLAPAIALGILNSIKGHVVIGNDGVSTRWLGLQRFVPWSEVSEIDVTRRFWFGSSKGYGTVDLTLADGTRSSIAFTTADAELVAARMRERLSHHRRTLAAIDAATLERGERSHDAWIAHLRSVGDGSLVSHRTPAATPDRFVAIAASDAVPDAVRVGAALAAIGRTREAERIRIREVASTLASPKLRVALERAADPQTSDEVLAEQLAELEQADAVARQAR